MKAVDDREAWENLANAIILSSVKDYRRALLHLKRNPDSRSARQAVAREEKFFYSSWFEVLTDLDPSYLIWKMKETVGIDQ